MKSITYCTHIPSPLSPAKKKTVEQSLVVFIIKIIYKYSVIIFEITIKFTREKIRALYHGLRAILKFTTSDSFFALGRKIIRLGSEIEEENDKGRRKWRVWSQTEAYGR